MELGQRDWDFYITDDQPRYCARIAGTTLMSDDADILLGILSDIQMSERQNGLKHAATCIMLKMRRIL